MELTEWVTSISQIRGDFNIQVIDSQYLEIVVVCIQIGPELGNGHVHDENTSVKSHIEKA